MVCGAYHWILEVIAISPDHDGLKWYKLVHPEAVSEYSRTAWGSPAHSPLTLATGRGLNLKKIVPKLVWWVPAATARSDYRLWGQAPRVEPQPPQTHIFPESTCEKLSFEL